MNRHPSILIIGAGLVGLSCADSLERRGADVSMIEAQSGPGLGPSFANSGMIHPSQAAPWDTSLSETQYKASLTAIYDLASRSKPNLLRRLNDFGINEPDRAQGCLQLFDSDAERDQRAALLTRSAIPNEKRAPSSQTFDRPALFFPEDFSGNPYQYACALEKSLKSRHVSIHYDSPLLALNPCKKGRVSVQTPSGQKEYDHVIVACGLASAPILNALDIRADIKPERGFALDFKRPDHKNSRKADKDIGFSKLSTLPVMDFSTRSALTVFSDRIRLSGTTGRENSLDLVEIWSMIAPDLIDALEAPILNWSAERPMGALGRPYIGPTPIEGLWVNAGHCHMGWTLCTGSGDLMAKMIIEGHTDTRFALLM